MNKDFNTLSSFEFEALRHSSNYKQWIWQQFAKELSNTTTLLEVGAGVGQFTEVLQNKLPNSQLTTLEPCTVFYEQLTKNLPKVEAINLYSKDLIGTRSFDSIININVLEHIEDDTQELKNWNSLLNKSGTACVLVPALMEIYAPIDNLMGHYRRYTKAQLIQKFESAGFKIKRLHYFNFLGYWLWLINFKLLKNTTFSPAKVAFNDRYLIHLCKALDSIGANSLRGQSLICIAEKI